MRLPRTSTAELPPVEGQAAAALLTSDAYQPISEYLDFHYGRGLDQLLAPIGDNQVGESVRHNGVYFEIKEARRADDPTLPQGVWEHDLKTAEWDVVEKTALEALCHKSKDLQLGVWLMESSIHRKGFAGIAPGAVLIKTLCQAYWESMHPQMQDGDIEFRTNPINWINEKLSLQLRLVPITETPIGGKELCWDDWENAKRIEQLQRQHPGGVPWEGATTEAFKQRLAATTKESLLIRCGELDDGRVAIHELVAWLDQTCAEDSPSLGEMTSLIDNIYSLVSDELRRRGVDVASIDNQAAAAQAAASQGKDSTAMQGAGDNNGSGGNQGGGDGEGGGEGGTLRDRSDAFAMLRRAAEFLMRDDPHSPVPYMVYTACDWGEKNAPDLYRELFLQKGGQLNIFEVMGLQTTADAEET